MIILGIDPGTSSIGQSILEAGASPRLLYAGVLRLDRVPPGERLIALHQQVKKLINLWRPEAFAIEKLFFAKNAKTAMAVSESRGALLLTAALAGLRVYEYTPLEIKKAVTGDGTADKRAIQKMVTLTLPETRGMRARDDVFDAIAVALTCHFKEFSSFQGREHIIK